MKAFRIAMALCSMSVLWPAAARADVIRAQAGAATCKLDHQIFTPAGEWSASGHGRGPVVAAQHSAQIYLEGDATFERRGALEHSAHFANHGAADAFADDRTSFHDAISVDGFGADLKKHITIALRKADHHEGKDGKSGKGSRAAAIALPAAAQPDASPTPEPASLLLIGTGLAGLVLCRRQLFA